MESPLEKCPAGHAELGAAALGSPSLCSALAGAALSSQQLLLLRPFLMGSAPVCAFVLSPSDMACPAIVPQLSVANPHLKLWRCLWKSVHCYPQDQQEYLALHSMV